MKPRDRDPILYISDIILSMERVKEYIVGLDFQHFKRDYKTVDVVIRNFEIIGEATKNLPNDIKGKYPSIPWEEMYRLRNRISHEYFVKSFTTKVTMTYNIEIMNQFDKKYNQ